MGLKLPGYYVNRVRKKRYHNIQKALSDTLDLRCTICAGGWASALPPCFFDRVSRELAMTYPEISEELLMTSIELGILARS